MPLQLTPQNDFQLSDTLKKYPDLRMLIGSYQELRNRFDFIERHYADSQVLISSTLQRTDHLALPDQVIVLCQHVKDLRNDIVDLKLHRRRHRRNSLIRYREVRRLNIVLIAFSYFWLCALILVALFK